MSEVLKRSLEQCKLANSANGSAPKKKRSTPVQPHHSFKPVLPCLSWPRVPTSDVTADNARVKWEVVAIYNHLARVYGGDEAARKMDYLTAPTTLPSATTHMRKKKTGTPGFRHTRAHR